MNGWTTCNFMPFSTVCQSHQTCLLVIRPTTIIHQDLSVGELVPIALTREVNVVTESSAYSEAEIRESVKEFQSLIVWWQRLDL